MKLGIVSDQHGNIVSITQPGDVGDKVSGIMKAGVEPGKGQTFHEIDLPKREMGTDKTEEVRPGFALRATAAPPRTRSSWAPRDCIPPFANLLALAGLFVSFPAAAQTPPPVRLVELPGHIAPALAQATQLPKSAGVERQAMTITVVLRRTDEGGFRTFEAQVNDPKSPLFRQFLTQTELAQRFGPSQSTYDSVEAYLTSSGLDVVQGSANR